jgi:hypothetical protein
MTRYGLIVIGLVLACTACSSDSEGVNESGARPPSVPSPIGAQPVATRVTRLRAYVKDARVQVFVQGELGDGCTRLEGITQHRVGNSIDLTVNAKREGDVCTMIMQMLNEWVPIDGSTAPGSYVVTAGKIELRFDVVRDAAGDLRIEPDPGPLPTPPYLPF